MTTAATLPRLLVLTDRTQLPPGRDLTTTMAACVQAGASHVILRELDLPLDERAALAARLLDVRATVIAAHEQLPGCAGVHLPASGLVTRAERAPRPPAAEVEAREAGGERSDRRLVAQQPSRDRSALIVGRSCHSAEDVERAAAEGADYATLSPFAATESKPGYGPPLPPDAYAGHPIPVFGLGGIAPDNAAKAVAAGAHGVAVMGAVMRADDPAAVAAALLAEVTT